MSQSKGIGCLVPVLALALAGSLACNYLQQKGEGKGSGPIVSNNENESSYLRSVAEAFGLRPDAGRLPCDIATDLRLLAGSMREVPRAQLTDKTITDLCEVLSKEDAEALRKGHQFIKSVTGKRIVILETGRE